MFVGLNRRSHRRPSPWAALNTGHPLAQGLHDCLIFHEHGGTSQPNGGKLTNIANPAFNASFNSGTNNQPDWKVGNDGVIGWDIQSADDRYDIENHGNVAAGDLTVWMRLQPRTWPGSYTNLWNKGGSSGELACYINTSGQVQWISVGGSAVDGLARGSLTLDRVHDLVLTRRGTTCQLYVDGLPVGATFTLSGTTGSSATCKVGKFDNTNPNCTVFAFATWTRALLPGEVQQLHIDRYPFLLPPSLARLVHIPAGAGGSAHTQSCSETLSLTDTRVSGAYKAAAETYSLTDALVKGAGKGLSDTLSLSDARTAGAGKVFSDLLSLTDARTAGAGKVLSDSLALSDSVAGLLVLIQLLSESITFSDSLSKGTAKALAEALSLLDGRAMAGNLSLAETLALADALASVLTPALSTGTEPVLLARRVRGFSARRLLD